MFYNYNGEEKDKSGTGSANANGSTPPENNSNSTSANTNSHSREGASNDSANDRYSDPWREPLYTSPKKDLNSFYSPSFQSNSKAAYAAVETKPKKEKSGAVRFFALLMVCLILCSAGSALTTALVIDHKTNSGTNVTSNQVTLGSPTSSSSSDSANSTTTVTGNALTGAEIYDLACQQAVGVNTSITTTNIFGQESQSAVSGSGFIISEDGYILTNYHVIEYAAVYGYDLNVVMFDGSSYPAAIIGYEADNDTAVIKIDATGLNAVTFGNSDDISVGDTVYAVGNPLGELTYTMTTGTISALDRFISTSESTNINMFQIDAAVNSGNSGGPVYNEYGQVIGIVTAKYSEAGVEGLGFVIPINDALDIATQLIENGYVSGKAFFGITAQDISSSVAQYFNMPSGVYVYSVTAGSSAEKAGIKTGDVITAFGDYTIASYDDLKAAIKMYKAGDTVKVTVYRSGETFDVSATLDEQTSSNNSAPSGSQQQQQQQQQTPNVPNNIPAQG